MILKGSAGNGSVPQWIKSSYSTDDGPACVEIASARDVVRVRDSKDVHGPRLTFTPAAWTGFLTHTRRT